MRGRLGVLAFVVCCFVLAAPSVVFAQAAPVIKAVGSGPVVNSINSGVRTVSVDMFAANEGRYIARQVAIHPASVRTLAQRALAYSGPAGVALAAGLAAYDLIYDDGQIKELVDGDLQGLVPGRAWRMTPSELSSQPKGQLDLQFGSAYFRSYTEVIAAYSANYCGHLQLAITGNPPSGQSVVWGSCNFVGAEPYKNSATTHQLTFQAFYCFYQTSQSPCTVQETPAGLGSLGEIIVYPFSTSEGAPSIPETWPVPGVYEPAPDAVVDGAVSNQQLGKIIAEAIRHGYANEPGVWPELADAIDALTKSLTQSDPDYDPVIDDAMLPGQPVLPADQLSERQPGESGEPSEWPAFCEWVPIVCALAEWIMNDATPPEDVELPIVDATDDLPSFDSGLGGGSCPSPVSTSFMGATIDLSYTTACDALQTYFRPVLLLIAYVAAGFILVGARV